MGFDIALPMIPLGSFTIMAALGHARKPIACEDLVHGDILGDSFCQNVSDTIMMCASLCVLQLAAGYHDKNTGRGYAIIVTMPMLVVAVMTLIAGLEQAPDVDSMLRILPPFLMFIACMYTLLLIMFVAMPVVWTSMQVICMCHRAARRMVAVDQVLSLRDYAANSTVV